MYPSGPWRGWWEQLGWGRQPMGELVLRFEGRMIRGEGHDIIGPFVFSGTCDDRGGLTMRKQYTGRARHYVDYRGTYDGEGSILGVWTVGQHWSGPFALSPVPPEIDADTPIIEIRPG